MQNYCLSFIMIGHWLFIETIMFIKYKYILITTIFFIIFVQLFLFALKFLRPKFLHTPK